MSHESGRPCAPGSPLEVRQVQQDRAHRGALSVLWLPCPPGGRAVACCGAERSDSAYGPERGGGVTPEQRQLLESAPLTRALLSPETAREDIVNALSIVVWNERAGYSLLPDDLSAIRNRLESALRKMGPR